MLIHVCESTAHSAKWTRTILALFARAMCVWAVICMCLVYMSVCEQVVSCICIACASYYSRSVS